MSVGFVMGALGSKLRTLEGGRVAFWCPGCDEAHQVGVDANAPNRQGPIWGFNGDGDKPTFTPSVLVRSGHYVSGHTQGECWCDFEQRFGRKAKTKCFICHSFVTDGRIQFLGDCTHDLAGHTVDLPNFPTEVTE